MANPRQEKLKIWAIVTSAVTVKTTIIFLFYWMGRELEKKYAIAPYGVGGGLLLGFCIGFAWLIYILKRNKL